MLRSWVRCAAASAVTLFCLLAVPAGAAANTEQVVAYISLSDQRMDVYVEGYLEHSWAVSTARRGYRTPTGSWRPVRTHKMWYSRKYDMTPMPYSIFFYKGYAIHGTDVIKRLGRPASHGCVRLHPNNAKQLYGLVKSYGMQNTRIVITQ